MKLYEDKENPWPGWFAASGVESRELLAPQRGEQMKKFLLVVVYGAVLGALVGAASGLFLRFLYEGIHFVWYTLPELTGLSGLELTLYPLGLGLPGGLLVGLSHHFLGDHPKLLDETIAEFQETKRIAYKYLPQGMITAAVPLFFGASLGPEAALVDLTGGLGTWASDQLKRAGQRLGLLAKAPDAAEWSRPQAWALIAGAAITGLLALVLVVSDLFGAGFLDTASYQAQWLDLAYAILPGLVGTIAGLLFLEFLTLSEHLTQALDDKPIWRSLPGGLVLGILAMIFPLVRFSGQHEMQVLRDGFVQMGFWSLLLLGASKLFLTAFLIKTGWKGGQFLPIMFSSVAVGLAVGLVFPAIPPAVAMVAAMAAATTVVVGKPVAVLPLMLLMFSVKLVGAKPSTTLPRVDEGEACEIH